MKYVQPQHLSWQCSILTGRADSQDRYPQVLVLNDTPPSLPKDTFVCTVAVFLKVTLLAQQNAGHYPKSLPDCDNAFEEPGGQTAPGRGWLPSYGLRVHQGAAHETERGPPQTFPEHLLGENSQPLLSLLC